MSSESPVYAVISQGCAANFGEGERIARALSAGHPNCHVVFRLPDVQDAAKSTPSLHASGVQDAPDAIYLNVCTVKGNAGALKLLRTAFETYPDVPLFITGCAPKDFREEALKVTDKVVFTSLEEIPASAGMTKQAGNDNGAPGTLRESPFVGIVNIEEGCLDACAFCSTHLVKGRLKSYAPEGIVEQVRGLVADGCLEIQLTGQDCACYGFDTGTNLAALTQRILVHVPGNYRLRLGMGNPRHMIQYADALLDCFRDERVYKFVHVPVQSGSDRVLRAMNRRHTAEDFRQIARMFNTEFRRFTLSTDIIVGFPG